MKSSLVCLLSLAIRCPLIQSVTITRRPYGYLMCQLLEKNMGADKNFTFDPLQLSCRISIDTKTSKAPVDDRSSCDDRTGVDEMSPFKDKKGQYVRKGDVVMMTKGERSLYAMCYGKFKFITFYNRRFQELEVQSDSVTKMKFEWGSCPCMALRKRLPHQDMFANDIIISDDLGMMTAMFVGKNKKKADECGFRIIKD